MAELSPATQKVYNAFNDVYERTGTFEDFGDALAAAIRAAVDQSIPVTKSPWGSTLVPVLTAAESRNRILAIAAELES